MGVVTALFSRSWPAVLIVTAGLAALWFLVVSPRLQVADLKAAKQATELKAAKDDLTKLQAQVAGEAEIDAERVAAVDDARDAKIVREQQTIIIREAAAARAAASGDPEVSESLDAFFADIRREQGK